MTDTTLLKDVMRASGLKLGFIAEKLGMSRQSLYRCLKGKTEFKQSQIAALCDILSLNNEDMKRIFFKPKGE